MSIILTIARYCWLEAMRNRLLWFIGVFFLFSLSLTAFIGELAIAETVLFQSAFLGAVLRFGSVVVMCLLVITSMVREFNDRGLWLILSLPMPRASYFFGKFAGFSSLAVFLAMLCCFALLIYVPAGQVMIWGISMVCELVLIVTFSLLCVFAFEQVTLAFVAVMAFYVLSRGIDAFELIATTAVANGGGAPEFADRVMSLSIGAIAFILPEFHHFTSSDWLVYHTGVWSALLPVVGQTAVYLVMLMGAALFDLYRKAL
ncbi:MAG: ABC transporter permease [Gammaproteobacteria bacterium]|nr:ABC transporter permease [Gammaproteobacteria bacterium]NNJ84169.1 ABC transporter permease [Gammaproteobacteria bacterium]